MKEPKRHQMEEGGQSHKIDNSSKPNQIPNFFLILSTCNTLSRLFVRVTVARNNLTIKRGHSVFRRQSDRGIRIAITSHSRQGTLMNFWFADMNRISFLFRVSDITEFGDLSRTISIIATHSSS